MRHGNPIAETLKFPLLSAVEILPRLQSLESELSRERHIGLPAKKMGRQQAGPSP
jgi:hypothetical protein